MNELQLMNVKARPASRAEHPTAEWQVIADAPFDRELELAVIDGDVHALVFPCRRAPHGWVQARSNLRIDVHPTHWRNWDERVSA